MFALLIPLLIQFVPEIVSWIGGDKEGETAQKVAAVATQVLGVTDPAAVAQALGDPAKLADLRLALAKVAADQEAAKDAANLAAMQAAFADTAGARSQTIALATQHSPMQYGAALVSVIVLVTFGVVMWLALSRTMPAGSEAILNVLLGTLSAMSMGVVSYWVGSSAGSAAKTGMLYNSTPAQPTNGGNATRPLSQ